MIDKIFIDTNFLIYLFDKTEQSKQDKAKELITNLLSSSRLYISVQVINEFINVTATKVLFTISCEKQKEIIDLLNELFIIVPLNLGSTLKALELKDNYKLSFWDSLIAASALENKCNILISEDLHNGLIIENSLTVVNPFI
jgi:predicted nucleic acid-binding protein